MEAVLSQIQFAKTLNILHSREGLSYETNTLHCCRHNKAFQQVEQTRGKS
jgi:hypothetical protein